MAEDGEGLTCTGAVEEEEDGYIIERGCCRRREDVQVESFIGL